MHTTKQFEITARYLQRFPLFCCDERCPANSRRPLRPIVTISSASSDEIVFLHLLYFPRRRKGSEDFPGLQSRRFAPYRTELWIRLPHASPPPDPFSPASEVLPVRP